MLQKNSAPPPCREFHNLHYSSCPGVVMKACWVVLSLGLISVAAEAAVPLANGKIVFVSGRDGNFEIYTMNDNGSGQTRLTRNAAVDGYPDWRLGIDMDRDGVIDKGDNCRLVANANQRGTNGDTFGNICDPDFSNNGVVNSQGGSILKSRFGQAPGPSGLLP